MGETDQKLAMDVFAWFLNVSTSVCIVFVNKVLMGDAGYGFKFATTLCSFHFLASSLSIWTFQMLGYAKKATIPWLDTLIFALAANVSIGSLNLSLMINSVGFYQIAKLLITPFVAVVEFFWLGKRLSGGQITCMAVVLAGVALVTVSDVEVNTTGFIIACISVVSSGMQQILCGVLQRKHQITSHQLLSNTAPVQGWTLLFLGPYIDLLVGQSWILDYDIHIPGLICLALSCSVAVAVNISQFMCLGRFSTVTFQVLGHSKTMLVLTGGWLFLGEAMPPKKLCGMALAVLGMVAYAAITSMKRKPQPRDEESKASTLSPLPDAGGNGAMDKEPLIKSAA